MLSTHSKIYPAEEKSTVVHTRIPIKITEIPGIISYQLWKLTDTTIAYQLWKLIGTHYCIETYGHANRCN